jgi:hypothetical protein
VTDTNYEIADYAVSVSLLPTTEYVGRFKISALTCELTKVHFIIKRKFVPEKYQPLEFPLQFFNTFIKYLANFPFVCGSYSI